MPLSYYIGYITLCFLTFLPFNLLITPLLLFKASKLYHSLTNGQDGETFEIELQSRYLTIDVWIRILPKMSELELTITYQFNSSMIFC